MYLKKERQFKTNFPNKIKEKKTQMFCYPNFISKLSRSSFKVEYRMYIYIYENLKNQKCNKLICSSYVNKVSFFISCVLFLDIFSKIKSKTNYSIFRIIEYVK